MNMNNKKIFLLTFTLSSFLFATDYDDDTFDNYISGQGANDSLSLASTIICYMSNTGASVLTNAGDYKAAIYADECETADASSSGSSGAAAAKPKSANSASTSSSSGTASNTVSAKDVDIMILNSKLASVGATQDVSAWLINDEPYDEDNFEPKYIMYINHKQTAGVSTENPFGNFSMKFQGLTLDNDPAEMPSYFDDYYKGYLARDGQEVTLGRLDATGNTIKFKNYSSTGEDNLVANFSDNGDVSGVYTRFTGAYDVDTDSYVDFFGEFGFSKSKASKTYCTKMTALYKINSWNFNEETGLPDMTVYTPTGTILTDLDNQGWDTEEICYSTDAEKAIRNVWQYGVYNDDGSRYNLTNQAIPIRTIVNVNGEEEEAYGFASYWGVWIDDTFKSYFQSDQKWTPDTGEDSDANTEYTVASKDIIIERTDKSYLALNEIDGLTLSFYANDDWWSTEFKNLGFKGSVDRTDRITFKNSYGILTDYEDGDALKPRSYTMYGTHDGQDTFDFNLSGAKLDKDNLIKLIRDESDNGTPLNFGFELASIPRDWVDRETGYIYMYICSGTSITWSGTPGFNDPIVSGDQECLRLEVRGAKINTTNEDNPTMTLTNGDQILAEFFDSDGNVFGKEFDNQIQEVLEIGNSGPNTPSTLSVKISNILTKFGSVLLDENDPSSEKNIKAGIESFINSSSDFTFFAAMEFINLFDSDDNRFNKISGNFSIDSSPPIALTVDDTVADEGGATMLNSFAVSLSEAATASVSFDYTISTSDTAEDADYSGLSNGTVTLSPGTTSYSIPFTLVDDTDAEEKELLTLNISNLVAESSDNVVLTRTAASAVILDDDSNTVVFNEYEGSYNAATQTFSFDKGLTFEPNFTSTTLTSPITFTVTQWLNTMKKTWDAGTEYENIEIRELGVWSNDTQQYYNIQKNSFENPTSNSSTNGIITETRTQIKASELPANLYCIQGCLIGSKIIDHYTDVKSQYETAAYVSNASPTPLADVGPYIKSQVTETITFDAGTEWEWTETRTYARGEWADGIIEDDVIVYAKANDGSGVTDPDGNPIRLGVDLSSLGSYPADLIYGANYVRPEGWQEQTAWGVQSGTLVDSSNLERLECDKNADGTYVQTHPEYTAANGKISKKRYCTHKFWDASVMTTYNIRVDTNPQYNLIDSTNNIVTFDPPKALYFEVPDNSTVYGDDAGKKLRLEYHGFGELYGIPGHVVDITKGSDDPNRIIGEYYDGEWNNNYRYVNRIRIPDGSTLTDNTTGSTYKVKALFGEEWLSVEPSAKGTLSYSASIDDVLKEDDIYYEIGPQPIKWCDEADQDEYGDCQTVYLLEWNNSDGAAMSMDASWDNCYEYFFDEILSPYFNGYTTSTADQRAADDFYVEESVRCLYIGDVPSESDIINNGEPSVIHGKVVYTPSS